jgi:hypothetical protein
MCSEEFRLIRLLNLEGDAIHWKCFLSAGLVKMELI